MAKSAKITAFAYLRTSSAANIGEDKDSGHRQLTAIQAYAKRAGIELSGTYHDEAVKGSDPIDARPGFAAMLEAIEGNGTRTIVVETASRFARDLIMQEVGFAMLKERGIDLIAADNPSSFLDDTPTTRLIRQMLGAFAEFEKAMLVAKLKGARDRKRRRLGATIEGRKPVKVEGRKSIAEKRPETVAKAMEIARELASTLPKGRKPSLRDISAALAKAGHTTPNSLPYSPSAIARMLGRKG
jgi:DNA invertase Pin-like site-specific DNA recombinase